MAPDSEEKDPEIKPAEDGLEEAQKAQAERSWEEGYQALYNAREALLDSLCKLQRLISEEVSAGVVAEAHTRESLALVIVGFQEGFKEVNAAWARFQAYYTWQRQKADTLPPEAGEALEEGTWPPEADKPISLYPSAPAAGEQEAGEETPGNQSGQAD